MFQWRTCAEDCRRLSRKQHSKRDCDCGSYRVARGCVATSSYWSEFCSTSSPMRFATPRAEASSSAVDDAERYCTSKYGTPGQEFRRISSRRFSANFTSVPTAKEIATAG